VTDLPAAAVDVSALAINVTIPEELRWTDTYVSFPVPDRPELATLVEKAASRAGAMWAAHRGLS
jgi:hypothetical protein